jgi:hypothetical protein
MKTNNPLIIAVDVDDTITKTKFSAIVGFRKGSKKYINKLYDEGNHIILWTCRCDAHLDYAVDTLRKAGYKFHQANEHHPALIKFYGNDTRKLSFDLVIDDKGMWLFGLPNWFILYWMIRIKKLFIKKPSLSYCK